MSRRRLLTIGLASAGTVTLVAGPLARGVSLTTVWGLDPTAGRDSCGCAACAACQAHAANKLFASAAAADAGRAHARCRCGVVELTTVDPELYAALFTAGGGRQAVDRRWQWVQAALAAAPYVPTPAARPHGAPMETPGQGAASIADPVASDAPQQATAVSIKVERPDPPRVRSAWITRRAPAGRTMFVQIDSEASVAVTLSLTRPGRRLARRHIPALVGCSTIRVRLGSGAAAGPAKLTVRFRDMNGGTTTATRALSVPRLPAPAV